MKYTNDQYFADFIRRFEYAPRPIPSFARYIELRLHEEVDAEKNGWVRVEDGMPNIEIHSRTGISYSFKVEVMGRGIKGVQRTTQGMFHTWDGKFDYNKTCISHWRYLNKTHSTKARV